MLVIYCNNRELLQAHLVVWSKPKVEGSVLYFYTTPPTFTLTKHRYQVGMIAYNCSVHNSTLHIFNVERYVGWCCILHPVTFLMFSILVHVTFISSRCMLELKFAIYHALSSKSVCPDRLSSNPPCKSLAKAWSTKNSECVLENKNNIKARAILENL